MLVDQADLKRRRRIASRVLVSGSRGGKTDSEAPGPRPRPESESVPHVDQFIVEPAVTALPSGAEIGILVAEPASPGSDFLPGDAMQAPGLVDLKRRRRVASRVLLSDARRGDTTRTRSHERLPSPEQGQDNLETEPCARLRVSLTIISSVFFNLLIS